MVASFTVRFIRSAWPLSGMMAAVPFASSCSHSRAVFQLFSFESSLPAVLIREQSYGEPIRDTGHREHEGAGRPPIDIGLRARARYMAAPCGWPGCAVSADQ